ncbi:MAG: tetratricopeptide repeat protein, partial [Caldilineaceae bacterium]|nr:tetratricopeptide repeat protein [Caldilineaceae bacterium]
LFMKGLTLCDERGNSAAALIVFEDVLTRLNSCENENLKMVAQALVMKASIHQDIGQYAESKSAYGRALAIYAANYSHEPQDMEALVLVSKGIVCRRLGEIHEAIHCFETLVDRFSSNDNATVQLAIAHALFFVGHVQLEARQVVDAINTSNELEVGFGVLEDAVGIPFGWHAGWMRAKALVLQGRAAAAMGLLRLLVVGTSLDNEEMRQKELDNLLELIAYGAPPGDMVQVLSSESRTAATLYPLVLALRQLAGEEVRAPAEVIEVAADIRRFVKRLEAVVNGVAK